MGKNLGSLKSDDMSNAAEHVLSRFRTRDVRSEGNRKAHYPLSLRYYLVLINPIDIDNLNEERKMT